MKKNLLLLAAMLLMSVASFAWEKPAAPESQPVNTEGEPQYLWNTAGGFFLGANDWNTRASISVSKGYLVKIESTTETTGGATYSLTDSCETKKAWLKTFCDNNASVWVDNNSGANCDYWTITPADGNEFTIANLNLPDDGNLGVATDLSNKRLFFTSWFESQVDAEGNPAPTEATYNWYSVSLDSYKAYLEKVTIYNAAVALKAAIDDAKEKYPGIDLSAQEAVYNNESSTLEELNAATASVATSIKAYLVEQLKKATATEPMDATGFITNPSFETGNTDGWTVKSSDDTGAKANSNGTYHVDNADGDYVFNIWATGYPITQKITGLPSGIYQLSAGVTSSDDCTNVYIIANGYMTNREGGYLDNLRKAVTLEVNPDPTNTSYTKQQWFTTGTLYFAVEADSMTIGAVGCASDGVSYVAEGKWWYKADNFQLKYFGASDEAYKLLQNEEFGEKDVDPDETFAMKQLVTDYCSARDDFYEGTTKDQIYEGLKGMFVLADSLDANIAAYEAYAKQIETAQKEVTGKSGVYVDLLNEYLTEDAEPGYVPESVEGYVFKNGSYPYIEENKALTTPEMTAETKFAENLVSTMLKNTAKEGDDFTSALKNPNFSDSDGAGWTWVKTNVQNFMKTGGYTAFPCAEAWVGSKLLFDVYQEVAGVPDGLYQITANAFCRPDGATNVDPENQTINAFIYMNDFESAIKHIAAEGITPEDWDAGVKDEIACGEPLSSTSQGWTLLESVNLYTPGGMKSASQAFERGMYKQTVYGLVENGTMKLGIHKVVDDSETYANDQWCLWTNFKLTYMAKNADAVDAVCEKLVTDANYILSNQADKLVNEAYDALDEAVKDVEGTTGEEKYQAMIALNKAINNAKSAITLYDETSAALDEVNTAIDAAPEGQSQDIIDEAAKYVAEKSAALSALSLTVAEMKDIIAQCKEYVARLKIVGDWTKASESDPSSWVSFTCLFNSNFDDGNANGWTDTFTTGNHGYQSNSVYTSTEDPDNCYLNKFIEAWRSGNVALEDGRMYTTIDSTGYKFLPNLPAGKYTLTVDINSKNQGDAAITGGAYLYAVVGNDTVKVESSTTAECMVHQISLNFVLPKGTTKVELGIMTQGTKYNWLAADNFKLVLVDSNPEATVVRGDANNDGSVNNADIMYVVNNILGNTQEGFNKEGADADLNGEITTADIMYIVNFCLTGSWPSANVNAQAFIKYFIEKYVNQ